MLLLVYNLLPMDNDAKNVLMQYLYRLAEHEGISEANQVSFKKRQGLLEQLKGKNYNAWAVIANLMETFLREYRIANDQEKKDKAFTLWQSEHATAEKDKVRAEQALISYCREHNIPVGAIDKAVTG